MQNEATEYYPASRPWVEGPDGLRLAGGRCAECGAVCFPISSVCASCGAQAVREYLTPTRGRLYSYTEVHAGPRQFRTPYAVGYVDMEDGLRLFGQIDAPASELSPDAWLELSLGKVRENADGQPVVSYKFRKAAAQ